MTLTAVANVLTDPRLGQNKDRVPSGDTSSKNIPQYITKEDYFHMLRTFALSHRRVLGDQEIEIKKTENEKLEMFAKKEVVKEVFWIDENLDPYTGAFLIFSVFRFFKSAHLLFILFLLLQILIYPLCY